jgi:hypothetical protein
VDQCHPVNTDDTDWLSAKVGGRHLLAVMLAGGRGATISKPGPSFDTRRKLDILKQGIGAAGPEHARAA